MFEIINDTDNEVLELEKLNSYIDYVVKELELEKCEFNIIIIDNERIHEINNMYRGVDRETDVISFALEDNMDVEYKDFRLLGDIYIYQLRSVISRQKNMVILEKERYVF